MIRTRIFSPICEAVGSWDTSKVTTMESMFDGARSFNQSLKEWNTSSVVDMSFMFLDAVAFNQASVFLDLREGQAPQMQGSKRHEFMSSWNRLRALCLETTGQVLGGWGTSGR